MLQRRVGSAVGAGMVTAQRRHDHERWYGHALELDLYTYKFTNEPNKHFKHPNRTEMDVKSAYELLPKIDFSSSYELLLTEAARLNPHLGRKEFGNEMQIRLEKQSNTVRRAQALVKDGKHSDEKVEDTMIARIVDEEHMQAEMRYVKCIRANEVAEDNRLDILPGGSPHSLREKTRWNLHQELHEIDRSEINNRLMAWLPEKYHIVYFHDFQTVAAKDSAARKKMMTIVDGVEKDLKDEAKSNGWDTDLTEAVAELRDDVDPSRAITSEAIKKCSNLEQLEEWSRIVHEYNGDQRMYEIYARAAEITGNAEHKKILAQIMELRPMKA